MSTTELRMPLAHAGRVADRLCAALSPGCDRIAVAGSIRRRKPDIGDIEVVAIPARDADLFGDPDRSRLDPILDRLCRDGALRRIKGGDRYQQFLVVDTCCKLDLFLPGPATWGVVFTQRTGSAEFTHQLMTPHHAYTSTGRPGLLPSEFRVRRARLWRGDEHVPTPEESDFFRAIRLPWVAPEARA